MGGQVIETARLYRVCVRHRGRWMLYAPRVTDYAAVVAKLVGLGRTPREVRVDERPGAGVRMPMPADDEPGGNWREWEDECSH